MNNNINKEYKMKIPKPIKTAILKYGLNLPVDRRTNEYKDILKKNNLSPNEYIEFTKKKIKVAEAQKKKKIKSIQKEVQEQKTKEKVKEEVKKRNTPAVRYVGNISVKFEITEDKEEVKYETEDVKDGYLSRRTRYKKEQKLKSGSSARYTIYIEYHDIRFDHEIRDKKEIDNIIKEKTLQLAEKIFERSYVIDVKQLDVTNTIKKYTSEKMENIRMKKSGSMNIDGYDAQPWDTGNGTCVYDYIIHTYKDIKGFKKICTYEKLDEIFNDPECRNNGVSTLNISNWCTEYGVSMSAFNDAERRFYTYTPETRRHSVPAMIYRINDGHFYPIPANNRKSLITISSMIEAQSEIIYNVIKEAKKSIIDPSHIKEFSGNNPIEELGQLMKEKNKKPSAVVVSGGYLKSFKMDGVTYTVNKNIDFVRELCENMKIDYVGQSLGNILLDIIKETHGDKFKHSHHNPHTFKSLKIAKTQRVHCGLIKEEYKKYLDDEKTVAVDINKCYSSIMNDPVEEWIRYDYNDVWEEYDGKDIKLGLYYVETDDTLLFRKNDIYSSAIIKKALTEKIDFKILYQLIPTHKEDKKLFSSVITNILKYCNGNTALYKLLINTMSGMLAKTKKTTGTYSVNNDIDQIFAFCRDYPDAYPVIKNIPETEHFLYGAEKELLVTENNISMYIQILDQSNIKGYDMIKEAKGLLIARKVDCAVFHYLDEVREVKTGDEWGQYRYCEIPVFKKEDDYIVKEYELKIEKWKDYNINNSDDWEKIKNILVNKGGLLLQAGAGCGKTYTAKNIASVLSNVKRIAPTNKAALNLRGSTIHKFLNMDIDGNVSTAKLNQIKKNIKYIIVDEISMITMELWRRLAFIKQATGVIFLLLGDANQLPPVEDGGIDDYFNHPAVKYLVNNNRNILTTVKRFDLELKKILDDVIIGMGEIAPNAIIIKGIEDTRINIAYTHKTRKEINKKWNEKEKTTAAAAALFLPVNDGDEKHGQDMYIYKGLPVISRKNDNREGLYMNNETFTVIGYDDEKIILETTRPDDKEGEILHKIQVKTEDFQKLFYINYCTTIHKVQGATIREKFTIHDWGHWCMCKKAKYTALSRGTCVENIYITYDEEQKTKEEERKAKEEKQKAKEEERKAKEEEERKAKEEKQKAKEEKQKAKEEEERKAKEEKQKAKEEKYNVKFSSF